MKTKMIILLVASCCLIIAFLVTRTGREKSDIKLKTSVSICRTTAVDNFSVKPSFETVKESSIQAKEDQFRSTISNSTQIQAVKMTNTSEQIKGMGISEQEAVRIASEAIANIPYDKEAGVSVQREQERYVVTFPNKKPKLRPGEYFRGAPYAARIIIDEKTGKIIEVKIGS